MTFCKCGVGGSNTGVVSPQLVPKEAQRHIYVHLFDSDGNRNSIKETDFMDGVLPDTFVQDKLNDPDPTKRWYPTPGTFKNVTPSQNDDTDESFNDGSIVPVQPGLKLFNALMLDLQPSFVGKISALACFKFGVFEITRCGNLEGVISTDDTELYPKPIDNNTFRIRYVDATDTTVGKVSIDFQYAKAYRDADRREVLAEHMESDFLVDVNGLSDILPEFTNITADGWDMLANTCYGEAFDANLATGLVLADFVLVDSAGAPIVITTVTEGPDGNYAFVIPTTAAETLTLTLDKPTNAAGWDMEAQEIVTP